MFANNYSVFKLSTGLLIAAFIDLKVTVIKAINIAATPDSAKIHH
jgi:hypothetical protein